MLLNRKLRIYISLNSTKLIFQLYFYLGDTGAISNLENKAHYSLKSGPIFKGPKGAGFWTI
jgi:hypothetical protein